MRNRWYIPNKILMLMIICVLFTLAVLAGCGEETRAMDPPKVSEYNKPGTVLMETVWSASISYPVLDINQDALVAYVLQLINSGSVTTEDEAVAAGLSELINNPAGYFIPTAATQSQDAETGALGSGFIITEDGYLVTNAHVVKMNDEELKYELASTALAKQVDTDIADVEDALGFSLSQQQKDNMSSALISAYSTYLTMGAPKVTTQLYMGVAVPGYGTMQKGTAVETIKVGEPSPGKDVAILKVNANNLPTVRLGDDTAVKEGDQAIALGYPGVATFNPLIDQSEENIKPSLTVGSVSGRKTMTGGWEVLQIDTSITHGNSGGPLFNKSGEVIGITTFGSGQLNSTTGAWEEVQGFNFAVPTSVVNQFLNEANVHPTEGALTKKYHEAVDLFDNEHYSAAKDKFKEIQEASASFPYVQEMIEQCVTNINAGKDKSTAVISAGMLTVIIIIVVLGGLLAALFLVILPNRKKTTTFREPAPITAGAATPIPPVAAPAPPVSEAAPSGTTPETPPPAPPVSDAAPSPSVAPPDMAPPAPSPSVATPEIAPPASSPSVATPEIAPPAPSPSAGGPAIEATPVEKPATGASTGEDEATEHNFCSRCGQPLDPGAQFCSKCGKPV